jgi:hypothetical protein
MDCGIDTGKIGEFYMLVDSTWDDACQSKLGMLCIGCIEIRLGRLLTQADFNRSFINARTFGQRSQRLALRLGLTE